VCRKLALPHDISHDKTVIMLIKAMLSLTWLLVHDLITSDPHDNFVSEALIITTLQIKQGQRVICLNQTYWS
jgi:hypothetical protein